MHQRPPADPSNKDDLFAPAGISFATMDQSPPPQGVAMVNPRDANAPAVDASTVYHGEASDETGGGGDAGGSHAVDLFDDVFGTSPTSGNAHHHEHQEHHHQGSHATASSATASTSIAAATASGPPREHSDHHPSDMNRLQQEHSTAGYREGLSAGKNKTLQEGFDEGYPLGAALGTMVGGLLGMLEGLVVALPGDAGTGEELAESLSGLLVRARQDLTARSIYSLAYFAPDGTWTYDLDDNAGEATIYDVAAAHPLIKTWRGIMDRQLDRRGIRWGKPGEEAALAAAIGLKDDESHGSAKAASTTSPRPDAAPATARAPASSNNASALDW
ncbi:Essential protein Yae1, N terminal [Sporothrix bragantina]|uniref:Protein YAE1 n=1 Tax=Sporothrix bragantina TaxID=671064 RepID=A0ABP0D0D8_9PEZI